MPDYKITDYRKHARFDHIAEVGQNKFFDHMDHSTPFVIISPLYFTSTTILYETEDMNKVHMSADIAYRVMNTPTCLVHDSSSDCC